MSIFVDDISRGEEQVPVSFVNEIDSEQLPSEWTYSAVNIPGAGADLDAFESGCIGCICKDSTCKESSCQCIALVRGVECGAFCPCGEKCQNRLVQFGVSSRLQVFKTDSSGFGVRTLDAIRRGSFVCEYASEIICHSEARRRASLQRSDNYILVLREHASSAVLLTIYDPRHVGNVGRFLNHSCSPNLVATPVRAVNAIPRLCFYTDRGVNPMEELTYDYAGGPGETSPPTDTGRLTPCRCSAAQCRKVLPFDPLLLELPASEL